MIGLKTSVLLLMRVFKVKRCAFRNFINDDNYNQTKKTKQFETEMRNMFTPDRSIFSLLQVIHPYSIIHIYMMR
jgi:hypothetical protein